MISVIIILLFLTPFSLTYLVTGGVGRGPGDVQRRPGRADILEPEREHLPGPSVGAWPGDAWRGPGRRQPLRRQLRSRTPAALRWASRPRPAEVGGLLQALHGLRP